MTITYPLTPPTEPGFESIEFEMIDAVAEQPSPFTFESEVFDWGVSTLRVQLSLSPLRREYAEQWIAFLAALRGPRGSFLLGDPAGATPRGAATGTPLVKGAGQTGRSLVTDGWTFGVTGILKAGDWIQLGSGSTTRLHKVLQDANSNGSGEATFDIFPELKASPGDNAAIVVTSTVGLWRLTSAARKWSVNEAIRYGIQFSATLDL